MFDSRDGRGGIMLDEVLVVSRSLLEDFWGFVGGARFRWRVSV